jgi:hypothetical protein
VIRYFRQERGEDGHEGILEAPVKKIGSQGIDGATVTAAETLDPEGMDETFEISPDIAVSPDTG